MNIKPFFFVLTFAFLFQSCDDNEDCCPMPEPVAEFNSGIFVLNEGNFGSGNASVSFINPEEELNQGQIFNEINGFSLGDTAQSIEMHEDMAIIVVNVSNKIEIVNRYTFESLGTISSNLSNPRYAEVMGDNLYVTNWGDGMNPDDDYVAVFNMSDLTFTESIAVSEGPEKLIAYSGAIYVAHKGGFSFNDLVSQIDASSSTVTKEIKVGYLPNSMVIKENDLWVLAAGKPSYADEETAGRLTRIDLNSKEVVESLDFSDNTIHPDNLNLALNSFYLTIGKSVYKYELGDSLPATPEFTLEEVSVLYGFEISDNKIYIASPRLDFTGNGDLYIYDLNEGNLLDQYSVGINPNGIYFN